MQSFYFYENAMMQPQRNNNLGTKMAVGAGIGVLGAAAYGLSPTVKNAVNSAGQSVSNLFNGNKQQPQQPQQKPVSATEVEKNDITSGMSDKELENWGAD